MKTKIVLALLVVVVLAGCTTKINRAETATGKPMELTPVWTFHAQGVAYNVYEFADAERREHCYVVVKWGDYRSGVALSCEKVGE